MCDSQKDIQSTQLTNLPKVLTSKTAEFEICMLNNNQLHRTCTCILSCAGVIK